MLIKNERSANTMPPLRDRDNKFNLSYDCFEKADILNRHFCSSSDLNDRNKDLPPFEVRCTNVLSQIVVSEQDILDMISTLLIFIMVLLVFTIKFKIDIHYGSTGVHNEVH